MLDLYLLISGYIVGARLCPKCLGHLHSKYFKILTRLIINFVNTQSPDEEFDCGGILCHYSKTTSPNYTHIFDHIQYIVSLNNVHILSFHVESTSDVRGRVT